MGTHHPHRHPHQNKKYTKRTVEQIEQGCTCFFLILLEQIEQG